MKSSLWVLCGVALLCFGSVRCGKNLADDDENFLDNTKSRDEGGTEKETDIEKSLYKARILWNELTNEISELSRMHNGDTNFKEKDNDKLKERGDAVDDDVKKDDDEGENDETGGNGGNDGGDGGGNDGTGDDGGKDGGDEGGNDGTGDDGGNGGGDGGGDDGGNGGGDGGGDDGGNDGGDDGGDDGNGGDEDKKKCSDDSDCQNEGKCEGEDDSKSCTCKDGTTGGTCEVIVDCKDGKYKECKGDKGDCAFKDGKAVCNCVEGKALNETNGYCQVDYCQEKCKKVTCKGNKFVEKEVRCECPDAEEDFVAGEKECKINYCRKVCGTAARVKCTDPYTKKEKKDCTCDSDEYVYINNKCQKTCSSDDDCKNEGKCEDKGDYKLCECKEGTTGDTCEVIKECSAKYKDCKGDKGTCVFKGGKADCNCPEKKALNKDKGYCEVDYCKQNCGDAQCEGNKFVEAEVTCECPEPDQDFDAKDKKCKKTCSGDDDCQNEGTCKEKGDYYFCDCKPGTTGDICEVIKECSGKYRECKGDKGECVFKDGKPTCQCPEGKALNNAKGYCEDDKCYKECGFGYKDQNDELKCVGGPFGNVRCQCTDSEKLFDPKEKECKTNYCKEKCGDVKCEGNPLVEEEVKCVCPNADQDFIEDEKKCKTNHCRKICGTDPRVTCDGDSYVVKKEKDCTCEDGYVFLKKRCQKTCSEEEDCQNGGKCKDKGEYKLCECKSGTTGDTCEVIKECSTKYKECKGDRGECVFKDGKATCQCPEGKSLYVAKGYCEAKCKEDADCEGSNRKCNGDKFCVCKDGYEGDECNVVTGCETLKEKCEKIDTECIFDKPGKPICKCQEGYTYDSIENKCKHPYCHPQNPCKQGECTEEAGTGYCKCPENKHYNYKTEKCEDLADLCFLRKTPCGENENCVKGKCICKNTIKEGEECKPKFCKTNTCFDKAKCSEEDGGSCYCEAGKYYNGKKCEDATCRFDDFKKNCTCPAGMERKDSKECQPKEGEACSKDCGYGLCVKKDDKETCKCFRFAVSKDGKCTLNSKFCVGRSLGEDLMKCHCTGIYTQASDGITCRLKTCNDDDVKKDCASRGGRCIMDWKNVGYDCECPKGYEQDASKRCMDPCSIEKNIRVCAEKNQLCYNDFSPGNTKTFTCGCPPTVQAENGVCSKKAEFAYLIKNIPVLKKRYEIDSGINKVLLNKELIQSMEQTFGVNLFDYGYLYDYKVSEDVLNCSVWINFKAAPEKTELDKLKLLPKKISNACEDCIENAVVWPPNVLLSAKGLEEAESNKLNFCTNEVKDRLCGEGTSCKDDRCTCKDGFKIIEYSIRDIAGYKVQRCEDINECTLGIHSCPANTTCHNTVGTYRCECNEGFKKQKVPDDPETDKSNCYDMCTPSPCAKGKCTLKGKAFDCECEPGVGGSFCDRKDENYASAKKGTVVVGAVLGTLLALGAIVVLYYIIKVRKNSGSEDFMPAPRMDHAEMTERRPMRGVVNKGYE